eukprot:5349868-Amphidinium_carterae.1
MLIVVTAVICCKCNFDIGCKATAHRHKNDESEIQRVMNESGMEVRVGRRSFEGAESPQGASQDVDFQSACACSGSLLHQASYLLASERKRVSREASTYIASFEEADYSYSFKCCFMISMYSYSCTKNAQDFYIKHCCYNGTSKFYGVSVTRVIPRAGHRRGLSSDS